MRSVHFMRTDYTFVNLDVKSVQNNSTFKESSNIPWLIEHERKFAIIRDVPKGLMISWAIKWPNTLVAHFCYSQACHVVMHSDNGVDQIQVLLTPAFRLAIKLVSWQCFLIRRHQLFPRKHRCIAEFLQGGTVNSFQNKTIIPRSDTAKRDPCAVRRTSHSADGRANIE